MGAHEVVRHCERVSRRALGAGLGLGALALAAGRPVGPVVARAARIATSEATPAPAGGAGAAGSLAAMLALAPDLPAPPNLAGLQLAQFADAAAQLAAVGAEPPVARDADSLRSWLRAARWLPFPYHVSANATDERWRTVFGFDALQIDRSLVVGEALPVHVGILRGRFDEQELRTAWEASGYRTLDEPGAVVYSIAEEQEYDLASEIGRLAQATMNNLALLPDGALLTATRLDRLRAAIATARGEAPSLLDRPDIGALVAAGDPGIAAAYLIAGAELTASDPAAAVRLGPQDLADFAAAGTMPPVALALLGITPGGPLAERSRDEAGTPTPAEAAIPAARFVVSLLMDDQADAEAAIPVVDQRLADGVSLRSDTPYAELFAGWDLDVAPDAPVLRIVLTLADGPPDLGLRMYTGQDLAFVFWEAE